MIYVYLIKMMQHNSIVDISIRVLNLIIRKNISFSIAQGNLFSYFILMDLF